VAPANFAETATSTAAVHEAVSTSTSSAARETSSATVARETAPAVTQASSDARPAGSNNAATTQRASTSAASSVATTFHLVVGAFDTRANAEKCVRQDPLRIGSDRYTIHPSRDSRYIVSAFDSTVRAEIEARRREFRDIKSDIWIYTMNR
jgi:hypothetical protein